MKSACSVLLIVVLVSALVPVGSPAESPTAVVSSQVEVAFRAAMEAWAYEQYWKLWEMGNSVERLRVTQEEFSNQMRNAFTRPSAGKQVESVLVQVNSLDSAMVYARIGIESRKTG